MAEREKRSPIYNSVIPLEHKCTLLSKNDFIERIECIRDGRTFPLTSKKWQIKLNPLGTIGEIQKYRCVPSLCLVALILKFQSVISWKERVISTENQFKIPPKAEVDKIRLSDLLKIHLGVEVDYKIENPAVFARRAR